MKLKLFYISLISCSILLSCEKDWQSIDDPGTPLLRMVLADNEPFYVYSYNETNLITEEKSKLHYTKHTYNNKNQLISTDYYLDEGMFSSDSRVAQASWNRTEWVNPDNTGKSSFKTFEYNDYGQLVKSTIYRPFNNPSDVSRYTYDENNRINRMTFYDGDNISGYIDYLYDGQGNLIRQRHYYVPSTGIAELWTTTEYEYDNMKNPYRTFRKLMTPGINTNPNNIIKETYTIHFEVDQWTKKVQITETSYDYNNKGYPIRVNGDVEYVYK